jgi:hypothetical protein
MPCFSEVALLALLPVAVVSVIHTAFRPFIPNFKPFNCAFCLAFWFAVINALVFKTEAHYYAIPFAPFLAGILSGYIPWMFFDSHSSPDTPPT